MAIFSPRSSNLPIWPPKFGLNAWKFPKILVSKFPTLCQKSVPKIPLSLQINHSQAPMFGNWGGGGVGGGEGAHTHLKKSWVSFPA